MLRCVTILAIVASLLPAGCTLSDNAGLGPATQEYDGIWTVVSDTGLFSECVTITGDRVTQATGCNRNDFTVINAAFGVHGDNQHIWTFTTSEPGSQEIAQRTISVTEQFDGSLRGTYAVRVNASLYAITDTILMVRRF